MPTKVNLNFPKSLWTERDSMRLAMDTLGYIKLRTSNGIDANGAKFKGYSTKPILIAKRGARLKPKGGVESRSGKSVYYAGGYKEYKHKSRERSNAPGSTDSAEVDLVLSGNMMNSLEVKEVKITGFKIGLNQHAQYGYTVNEEREFLGIDEPKGVNLIVSIVEAEVRKKIAK